MIIKTQMDERIGLFQPNLNKRRDLIGLLPEVASGERFCSAALPAIK